MSDYTLFWLIFCGVVAYFANKRGRNPVGWFLIAAITTPLLAGIALAIAKDLSIEEEINDLHKTTNNIKTEIEHNKQHNNLQQQYMYQKLGSSSEEKKQLDSTNNNKLALEESIKCSCGAEVKSQSKFCPQCGEIIIPKGKMLCPNCNDLILEDAKFCNICGHKLVTECPSCNTKLKTDLKFCYNCGQELAK